MIISAKQALRRFRQNEDGALILFGLMLFVLMVMMGGFAVDLMRYENTRVKLQNTLDRCTLNAAALSQQLDRESVVRDCVKKAGLSDQLQNVTVTSGQNATAVQTVGRADTRPMFLHMIGIEKFDAVGSSKAEQSITNIEIMLVLDVSGSMAANNKLTNLKSAANSFVSTVLTNDLEDKISIGIVPFNGQVNLGASLLAKFNATNPHGAANVNCVDLPATAYDSTTISQYAFATSVAPEALSMTANADTYSGSSSSAPSNANKWCPPQSGNVVRLPSQDIAALQGYITGLTAIGATSINAGMKWGLGLLDPNSHDIYSELVGNGAIAANLPGRPFDYVDSEAMKVVVLMTDGEHFAEERVNDAFKHGFATVFKGNSDSNYSIFHTGKVVTTSAATICSSKAVLRPASEPVAVAAMEWHRAREHRVLCG